MFNEGRMQFEVREILMNATVPPIDLVEIRRRMDMQHEQPSAGRLYARVGVAAAVVVMLGMFLASRSPALMQSLAERYRAALTAAGIGSGVPAPLPDAMRNAISQSQVSLSEAQHRANFTVVAPEGLPHDIVSRKILVAPLAVWLRQTNAWSFDGMQVTFAYARADGRTFDIIADRYSALSGPQPRYMYDSDTFQGLSRNGKPIMKRYENFVWRNGDQELRVVADPTISAREVESIRVAMHGVPLPTVDSRQVKLVRDRIVFYSMP